MRKWIIAVAIIAALAGCKSTDTQTPAPVEDRAAAEAAKDSTSTRGAGATGVTGTAGAMQPHRDPANMLSQKRSVYFDYDQFTIKDEYRATVEGHAKYLQSNRTLRLTLQGNTDERGTREYNIALSARRATVTREFLVSQGIEPNRITTIAFGKERPVALCDAESCWSQNRRAVTVVTSGAVTQ